MAESKKILRSREDRWLTGTAGGLAVRMEMEPLYVRIGLIVLGLITGGVALIAYIIAAILIEPEPETSASA